VSLAAVALAETGRAAEAGRLARRWTAACDRLDLSVLAASYQALGIAVLVRGEPDYPAALAGDHEAPAVLYSIGAPLAAAADSGDGAAAPATHEAPGPAPPSVLPPSVAVVGTRSATHYGMDVAVELGAGLAAAGVSIVSGLAVGIDASAHEGALAPAGAGGGGRPIGVAGAGLDVVYPRRTARLRKRVEAAGTVISEAPLGAQAEPWRFPLRNRIIAALSQVLVVVESHRSGGALHTVDAALARDVEVMAVPGSIHSRASDGTNALIAAGAQPVTCVGDVLVALARRGAPLAAGSLVAAAGTPDNPRPSARRDPFERAVLEAVEATPTTTQTIFARVGGSLGAVALALERLSEEGAVGDCGGSWVRTRARTGA
jgi:DNA processing protein